MRVIKLIIISLSFIGLASGCIFPYELDLSGSLPGLGDIKIHEASDDMSPGRITSVTPEQDFPVDAFFDVFTEIKVGGQTLVNQDPARIVSEPFTRLPIWNTPFQLSQPVLLFDIEL